MKGKSKSILGAITCALLAPAANAEPTLKMNGIVETEFYSAENYDGTKETEVVVATVEVALDTKINEQVESHILFLYEEGESDGPLMDEATISYALDEHSKITMGRLYLPFGTFTTNLVSDPLTLELGETNEVALMYSFERDGLQAAAYMFNGNSDTDDTLAKGDNTDLGYGLNFSYDKENAFSVNLGYLSNIADSEALQGLAGTNVADFVAGFAFSGSVTLGSVAINLEHVAALDKFQAGDLGGDAPADASPSASLLDVGMDVGGGYHVGLGYQATSDALFLGLPESAIAMALSHELGENARLALEYSSAIDYDTTDGGSGESATQLLIQLAAEF